MVHGIFLDGEDELNRSKYIYIFWFLKTKTESVGRRSIDRLGLVVLVVVGARVWCELLLIRLGFRCWELFRR